MALYHDSYYANTPAKKVRTQPKRECNNITYIYMNRDKRTIHNEPQYEARHEATKQNMFGLIGNQKTYEASLQRETIQYESVQIVDATKRSELKAVYYVKDGKTWVSAFNYNEFEKELIRKAARALKIAHNSPAHRAMNAEIKGICKHQGITTRTIVVYTVDEFIAILIHIKSCDYAAEVLTAMKNFYLSKSDKHKKTFINWLIYTKEDNSLSKFWSGLRCKGTILPIVNQQKESLRSNDAPLIHLNRTIRYFQKLKKAFKSEEDKADDESIARQMGILLNIPNHWKTIKDYAGETDYSMVNNGEISGESIATAGRRTVNGLKALCLLYNIESKNHSIEHCHDAVRLRKFKKGATIEKKKSAKPKEKKKMQKDFIDTILRTPVPDVVAIGNRIEKRPDIKFHQEVKNKKKFHSGFNEVQKDIQTFYNDMVSGKIYKELIHLYSMNGHMKSLHGTTPRKFVQYIVQTPEGARWVRMYFAGLVVAHEEAENDGTRYHAPSLLGNTLDDVYDMIHQVKVQLKGTPHYDTFTQWRTPLEFSRHFSMRKMNNIQIHVKSQQDYHLFNPNGDTTGVLKHPDALPKFDYGLSIIVMHGNRFRIVKKEAKMRRDDDNKERNDFNYIINEYEETGLHALCCDIVDAYEHATGHRVLFNNTEPRMAITKGHKIGRQGYTCTKIHLFPLVTPYYQFGSRVFISPVLPVGTQPNAVIKCLTNPEELLPNDLKALNVWKNEKYSKKVSQLTAQFTINGKEMELPLKAMNCAVRPPNTLALPNNGKANNPGVPESIQEMDKFWKTIVKTGKIVLPKKWFGKVIPIDYTGEITEHLRIAARECVPQPEQSIGSSSRRIVPKACTLEYDFAGRYGSAILLIKIYDYLNTKGNCNSVDILNKIDNDITTICIQENHVSRNVVKKSYTPYKCGLTKFASLFEHTSYIIDRMSSHPNHPPSWDKEYKHFVEYDGSNGANEDRFVNMYKLTTLEQNAQIFWFKLVWELYRVICKYNLTSLKEQWDKKMEVAQKRWAEKFKEEINYDSEHDDSLCNRLMSVLTGKKRKGDELVNPRVNNQYENVPV